MFKVIGQTLNSRNRFLLPPPTRLCWSEAIIMNLRQTSYPTQIHFWMYIRGSIFITVRKKNLNKLIIMLQLYFLRIAGRLGNNVVYLH